MAQALRRMSSKVDKTRLGRTQNMDYLIGLVNTFTMLVDGHAFNLSKKPAIFYGFSKASRISLTLEGNSLHHPILYYRMFLKSAGE